MSTPKVKMSNAGSREVLLSARVEADLLARAKRIANATGMPATAGQEGYYASSRKGRVRARASVITVGRQARQDNAENLSLLRNLDKGR